MKKIQASFLLLFCLFAVFFVAPKLIFAENTATATAQYSMEKIFYMNQSGEKKGIASLQANSDKVDIIAPQFYAVNAKMQLTGKLDDNLKKIISQKKLKVMPLVVNAGFSQSIIHKFLLSAKSQDAVITGLVYVAKKNNYIGWQFDFENINYKDKDLYSAFVEKSAKSLHENGFILSVAVVTRTCDYENTNAFKNWGGVYDYAKLAKAVDFISLMTYDDPNSVGPVASLSFVNKSLDYVKDKIPPEKLSLGIPLYNWGWSINPFKKLSVSGTYGGLLYLKSNFVCDSGFNAALGSSWLTYFLNNKQYQVWYQDEKSFKGMLDIINQNNFRGFSAWVIGIEDPAIWSTLNRTD